MKDFIKTFFIGLTTIVLFVFIVAFFALSAIFALGLFFVMFVKHIIFFFQGHNLKEPMDIDIEAEKILNQVKSTPIAENPAPSNVQTPPPSQQVIIQTMPGTVISTGIGPNGQPIIITGTQPINNTPPIQNIETEKEENSND